MRRLPFRPIIASIEKELSHGFASVTDFPADSIRLVALISGDNEGEWYGGDCW
jgi:hypothetical protein